MVKWRERKQGAGWRWNSTQSNTSTFALAQKLTKGAKGKTVVAILTQTFCNKNLQMFSMTTMSLCCKSSGSHPIIVRTVWCCSDVMEKICSCQILKERANHFVSLAGDIKRRRGRDRPRTGRELLVSTITSLKKIQQCTKLFSKKDALLPWCPREVVRQGRAMSLRLLLARLLRCLSYLGNRRAGRSSDPNWT